MIFQTQLQLNNLFIFVFFGILTAFIYSVLKIINIIKIQKKLIKNINNLIFYAFFIIFFVFLINFFNFGKFSLTLLALYFFGFISIKKHTTNLVVILKKMCYNIINKLFKKGNANEINRKN